MRRGLLLAALLAAVAVAFADSSIVVLALPDLLREYDASITEVAWVITAYNVAVAALGVALVPAVRRLDAQRLAQAGLVLFFAASIACGAAPSLWVLVGLRAAQGVGGALLLAGTLPLIRGLARRGISVWAGAGIVGAGLGPASGGLLTQLLEWRAIFYAQAPLAALALVATLRARAAPEEDEARAGRLRRVSANAALALVSAALVGLLFLAVVMLIDVWRLEPIAAAAVVSAIPLATLAAQPLARLGSAPAAGVLLLAGGLAAMGLLPSRSVVWAVAALAAAGFGVGLLAPQLTSRAGGTISIGARHLGLVAGLLILTPLLSGDLTAAGEHAKLQATSVVLDARLPIAQKLDLAFRLTPVLKQPASQGLPNFSAETRRLDPDSAALGRRLDDVVLSAVTRAFRTSYLVAALLALLALVPAAAALGTTGRREARALAVALAAAAALVSAELARGALSYGEKPRVPGPCEPRPSYSGGGVDATTQRLVLKLIDKIACRVGKSREELVTDLAEQGVSASDFLRKLVSPFEWLKRLLP